MMRSLMIVQSPFIFTMFFKYDLLSWQFSFNKVSAKSVECLISTKKLRFYRSHVLKYSLEEQMLSHLLKQI